MVFHSGGEGGKEKLYSFSVYIISVKGKFCVGITKLTGRGTRPPEYRVAGEGRTMLK